MDISVGTSWNRALIKGLAQINRDEQTKLPVAEVYGTMQTSPIGGGRGATTLDYASKAEIEAFVDFAHKHGIEVNYLLNAICIALATFDSESYSKIVEYLEWINNIRVDYVTIASTHLMDIVAKQFPHLPIVVSINAEVDTPQKAKYYLDEYNVARINLDFNVTRDFRQIELIRKAVDCRIEILANEPCLIFCPFKHDHQLDYAHGSQTHTYGQPVYPVDTPQLHCGAIRIEDRSQILKAPWLRPEDTVHLENIGVDYLKLAGRTKPVDWKLECTKAFARQEYEGNIYDFIEKAGICAPEYGTLFGDDGVEPLRFYINNRALDGFIEPFVAGEKNCRAGCENCGYCAAWAKRVVEVDESLAKEHLQKLEDVLNTVSTGEYPHNPRLVSAMQREYEEKVVV